MASQLLKTVQPAGGDYTTLEAAMNDNEQDLVGNDLWLDVEIGGDWNATTDETNCVIHNYTTDATRFIKIVAVGDAKHDGTAYKSTAYELLGADDAGTSILIGTTNNLEIKDFVINGRGNDKSAIQEASVQSNNCYCQIITHNSATSSDGAFFLIATSTVEVQNCIFFNVYRAVYCGSVSTTVFCRNCTAYAAASNSHGFLRVVCINCFSGNFSTEDFFSLGSGSNYNVSADSSAADEATNNATGKTSYTDYFESVTSGSEDFTLKGNSTTLWGLAGTDLSGIFTDDIIGTTRSAWDIGAFEFVGAGPVDESIIRDVIYSGLIAFPR